MSTAEVGGSALGPQDDRPLNQQEYQLLQRLLSDPFSLPLAFKTWLVSYLESSDLNLPVSAVNGLTAVLGIAGVGGGTLGLFPAGVILPYGGDTAPTGAKMCDGGSYERGVETRLFNAIGTKFGAVDAAHFNVPDLQGRMLVGKGTHGEVNTVGMSDGSPLNSRRPRHKSSVAESPHWHPFARADAAISFGSVGGQGAWVEGNTDDPSASAQRGVHARSTGLTVGPQDASAPLDTPAYLVVNFIIIA